jgi:hypothetical protein
MTAEANAAATRSYDSYNGAARRWNHVFREVRRLRSRLTNGPHKNSVSILRCLTCPGQNPICGKGVPIHVIP